MFAFKLERIMRILEQELGNPTTLNVRLFLVLAMSKELTSTELAKRLGCTTGGISRSLTVMSTGHKDVKGLGLVRLDQDHMDRRFKVVSLTSRGRQLAETLDNMAHELGVEDK